MTAFSGTRLSATLAKAAEAAIAEAVQDKASQLQQAFAAVDAGLRQPSLPEGGRAGEGGAEGAFSSPLQAGEVGPQGGVRDYGFAGETPNRAISGGVPNPSPAALRASTSPSGRGEAARTTLTLSAPNLFAREFGALDTPADPVIAPAIEALGRRRA